MQARGGRLSHEDVRYVAIGKINRAHGLTGEVSVSIMTAFPERFETTDWVYIGNEFEADAYAVEAYRWHKQNILLKLAGVDDRTEAEYLHGQLVQVPIDEAMPLPEGSYYLYQLLGLEVVTTGGEVLGSIRDIMETGANDVYVVETAGRDILLPAIPEVVKAVEPDQGRVVVELLEGLI